MSAKIEVLKNAKDKINRYDSYDRLQKRGRYNSAYHKVLNARRDQLGLVNEDGGVDESSLCVIEDALIAFDMGEQMDNQFRDRLRKKLSDADTEALLKRFREFTILSLDVEQMKSDTRLLFDILRSAGQGGLSSRRDRFGVGATKIMNSLFPGLFVIADKWVRKGLRIIIHLDFQKYWSIMMTCHRELEEWQSLYGNLQNLIEFDQQPTTPTRIFDKCAFVMGKFGLHADSGTCPRCGSPLKWRRAKLTGESYRGCTNFPDCTYNERSY